MISGLLLGAVLASSLSPAPTPVWIAPAATSAVSDADLERIEGRMAEAAHGAGLGRAGDDVAARAARCDDQPCLSRTLAAHGVSFWIEMDLSGEDRVYDLRLSLWSVDAPEPIATVQERCVVCGHADLGDLAAAGVHRLSAWTRTTDPSGAPQHTADVAPRPHATTPRDRTSRRPLRGWGIGALVAGGSTAVAGVTLLALDGRNVRGRCRDQQNIDADGDCRYVHDTAVGGGVLTGIALGLVGAGATLLTIDLKQSRVQSLSIRPQRRGVSVVGRF